MLRTYQILMIIVNRVILFPLGTSMIHRAKLTSMITQCNQEMEDIQLCLINRKQLQKLMPETKRKTVERKVIAKVPMMRRTPPPLVLVPLQ
jgi:hypothetical protein